MTPTSTHAIWTRLSEDLRRFIRRRVPADDVADDLLQETFVRVHRNLSGLEDAERLAAWVYQIARNVIHDHFRRAGIDTVALDGTETAAESKNELAPLRDLARPWCAEMIEQLPEGYRQAVQLAEIEGLPQQEVAERLGLSLSGAKSRIQRGRKLLKEELEQCCRFEFDRRGNLLDYEPKPERKVCRDCGE